MTVLEHATLLRRLKSLGYELGTFFDVGANIGRWSVAAQEVFPDAKFELFEPLAGRMVEIDSKSMVNQLSHFRLHSVALSDFNGPTEIKILGPNAVGSSLLILEPDRRKDIKIVPCESVRMDDIVERQRLPQPDFIKLDTQAAELKVLKGAERTIQNNKFILLETWIRRVYGPETPLFHEVSNWLYEHDYVLYEILLGEGRDADGTLRWFDAVYINKAASGFPRAML
jgi:FkbM family methyltransferase